MSRKPKDILKRTVSYNEEIVPEKVEFDKTKYQIVEKRFPFNFKFSCKYYVGDLGSSIKNYERNYGVVPGVIYFDPMTRYTAFTDEEIDLSGSAVDINDNEI